MPILSQDHNLSARNIQTPVSVKVPTYFCCECPVCGRRLRVRIGYMGKLVECPTCHRELIATGRASFDREPAIARADRLLQLLGSRS